MADSGPRLFSYITFVSTEFNCHQRHTNLLRILLGIIPLCISLKYTLADVELLYISFFPLMVRILLVR